VVFVFEFVYIVDYVDGFPYGKRGPLDLQTLYAPVQGNTRAKKWEWVEWGGGMGDFWDSTGNVNEENT
jgi:hypothetical protein